MKKILSYIVLALVTLSCAQAQKTELNPDALNSILIATDKSETIFQQVLDANKGKVVVIDVWASWCSDCIKGFPKYKKLQEQFPEVTYLSISMDKNYESWMIGLEKYGLKGQDYWVQEGMKGVFGKSIELSWIPRFMVIDREGKVALYNAIEADDAKMVAILHKLKK